MGYAQGNFASMANAISVDGYYIYTGNLGQFLGDVNCQSIVSVMPCTIYDANGDEVSAFQIITQNPKGVTAGTIYLPQNEHLTSIADFDAGLAAISGNNDFTAYTNLYSTSNMPHNFVADSTSVLLNDNYSSRIYTPDLDQTTVYVNYGNALTYTAFVFAGDQTFAGNQYYLYATGNVNPF